MEKTAEQKRLEKVEAAKAFLANRWVLHPDYRAPQSMEAGHVWTRTTNVADTIARAQRKLSGQQGRVVLPWPHIK